ncbi:F-box domain-containing protein [Mycena chlorophos]|uniref:F-box domain-containing protein n=1 Tax=Mycena chlorophos TaxID=658473 RepID=A0A8H6WIW6_MYCCL|nr:F-box domain-containing protein [Mycena chlorophos]
MSALAQDRARLEVLEAKMDALRHQLDTLEQQGQTIRDRLSQYTYPVLTLPPELVTEIFTRYIPAYPAHPPLVGTGSPTYLLGICRQWRDIALRSPSLWRAIKVTWSKETDARSTDIVASWLKRSRSSLLSLSFDTLKLDTVVDDLEAAATTILSLFVAQRDRWQYIDIAILPIHLPLLGGATPALVDAVLFTVNEGNPPPTITFSNALAIRSAYLWNIVPSPSSHGWLAQLTSLSLISVPFDEIIRALRLATNLIHCKLSVPLEEILVYAHIHLPRLQTLLLDFDDDHEECLRAFTLPALRRLELSGFDISLSVHEPLRALITRSACRLERLRLCPDNYGGDVVVRACVDALPDVTITSGRCSFYPTNWKMEEYWDPNCVDSDTDSDY